MAFASRLRGVFSRNVVTADITPFPNAFPWDVMTHIIAVACEDRELRHVLSRLNRDINDITNQFIWKSVIASNVYHPPTIHHYPFFHNPEQLESATKTIVRDPRRARWIKKLTIEVGVNQDAYLEEIRKSTEVVFTILEHTPQLEDLSIMVYHGGPAWNEGRPVVGHSLSLVNPVCKILRFTTNLRYWHGIHRFLESQSSLRVYHEENIRSIGYIQDGDDDHEKEEIQSLNVAFPEPLLPNIRDVDCHADHVVSLTRNRPVEKLMVRRTGQGRVAGNPTAIVEAVHSIAETLKTLVVFVDISDLEILLAGLGKAKVLEELEVHFTFGGGDYPPFDHGALHHISSYPALKHITWGGSTLSPVFSNVAEYCGPALMSVYCHQRANDRLQSLRRINPSMPWDSLTLSE